MQYPEEGLYDIWLVRNDQGLAQSKSNIPRTTLEYQIRDFDQDGQMELLVAGLNEESDSLDLQMYEIQNGTVVLQSELVTDRIAILPEDGILRCYSYLTEQNQRMIGCDLWSYVGYIADGTSLSTELFLYYRDYYPVYTENENGDFVEIPKDFAELKYTFDESTIKDLIDNLNLTVPDSEKEQ